MTMMVSDLSQITCRSHATHVRGESAILNSDFVSEEAIQNRQEGTQVKASPRSRHCHVRSAFGRVQKVELDEGSGSFVHLC